MPADELVADGAGRNRYQLLVGHVLDAPMGVLDRATFAPAQLHLAGEEPEVLAEIAVLDEGGRRREGGRE